MNRNPLHRMVSVVAMTLSLFFACGMGQRGGVPAPELSVEVIKAGPQGGGSHPEPSAVWITSQDELEQFMDTLKSDQLPAQGRAAAPVLDFNTSRIILVYMGQKPTAGYSLKLDPDACSISQETSHISLIWTEPDPGMVTAQVITSSFILLKLSKDGYDSVVVVDQHGQLRVDLPVDE